MRLKLQFTSDAEADLIDIGDWIARDNPARSVSFIKEVQLSCMTLAMMPRAYPLVPRYEQFDIRKRNHGRYLIFYRINGDQIEILRVLHSARDYESLLFPD